MSRTLLVSLMVGLWLPTTPEAQTSFDWLNDAVHPRGMALANASVAAVNPAEALNLNPAGLRWLVSPSSPARTFQLSLCRYPAGVNQLMTQIILPTSAQVLGIEIRRFNYGTFPGYDEEGLRQEDYSAADVLVRGGMMRHMGKYLAAGTTAGILSSRLEESTALAVLWSFGLQLEAAPLGARLGAVVLNRGRFITQYGNTRPDSLPATWLVGLTKSLAYLPLILHISAGENTATGQLLWRLGGEFRLHRKLALRLGVDQGKLDYHRGNTYADLLSGLSLGFGTLSAETTNPSATGLKRFTGFSLDGAVKFAGPLGFSASFALGLKF
ncbi:MAG: hypothetical protein JSU77_02380 [Fidelibacterota bacterium]|nr:MAG: hypothetical protein JSU77_02380 [Candidatus Neomarinimicrobiota bacterium]